MIIETIIITNESEMTQGVSMRTVARPRPAGGLLALLTAVAAVLAATAVLAFGGGSSASVPAGVITAVGAENEYANVIQQVGGMYVQVTALLSNPNTDPHTFEASIAIARQVGDADLVVQNGLGYDSFIDTIEAATSNQARSVIDVQHLLRLPDSTPNPHLWYDQATMPKVARAVAQVLSRLQPRHAQYFTQNASIFTERLGAWTRALAAFRAKYPHAKVATTEPVADYLLKAAGADDLTPWTFQADVMNGVDPSPQDVATEKELLTGRKVSVLLYNEQVTDPLTESLIALAKSSHIPVVGVYETMPEPGYDYQSWMLSATKALRDAVAFNR
jgi:zinc/manganese transport system substrate-binding protein